jgi:hypothetical protein
MKMNSHIPSLLNSYFKPQLIKLVWLFLLSCSSLYGVQFSLIYTGSCERDVGIILDVDDTKIKLLNQEGEIKDIKRFDIIYIAQYPVSHVSIPKIDTSDKIKITQIKTLYNNEVVELLQGWMTNYSDQKISFLTTEGTEIVIDIDNVWDISFLNQEKRIYFKQNLSKKEYAFVHPYPFSSCQKKSLKSSTHKIYPQHLLETPLLIKEELDRLEHGYQKLENYVTEKKFYSRPQIYSNLATLGIWASSNLRYGSSTTRNSNFIPVVTNELSEGLYQFQRTIITGTAPMPYSIHEEPQTQFYYHMKSSYFHFSFMFDLNQLIIKDYLWQRNDLAQYDDRQNETFHFNGGFDYGNFAFEYTLASMNYALKHDQHFYANSADMNRIGFFYSNRFVELSLYHSSSSGEETEEDEEEIVPSDGADQIEIDYIAHLNKQREQIPTYNLNYYLYRLNIDVKLFKIFKPRYSMLYKKISFNLDPDVNQKGNFKYRANSFTNVLYLKYDLTQEDLFVQGYLSFESIKSSSGILSYSSNDRINILKSGISIGLVF